MSTQKHANCTSFLLSTTQLLQGSIEFVTKVVYLQLEGIIHILAHFVHLLQNINEQLQLLSNFTKSINKVL